MKLLVLMGISISVFFTEDKTAYDMSSRFNVSIEANSEYQREALYILESKCNLCHAKRNRRMIFTLDNMNPLSPKINEQVFIRKRMPKGNNIKLLEEDVMKLKNWLNTLK